MNGWVQKCRDLGDLTAGTETQQEEERWGALDVHPRGAPPGWHVRDRDPDGRQHTNVPVEDDARAWLSRNDVSIEQGTWVDPAGGRVLFDDRYKQWWASNCGPVPLYVGP